MTKQITDCSTCRHHSSTKVPKTVEVIYDENIITSDETELLYSCKHPMHVYEVGRLTILCSEYEPPKQVDKAALDEFVKRFENRKKMDQREMK